MIMVSKDKAYIVANEQQECEVLEKLERDGFKWMGGAKPTEFRPSKGHVGLFPYVIYVGYGITWNILTKITSKEIVYDGRKESKMSEKYAVSQEFMNELKEWWETYWTTSSVKYVDSETMLDLFNMTKSWWVNYKNSNEQNNRLIAIIRWVNGENVFEVEKPKKWVVRSNYTDINGMYWYVSIYRGLTDMQLYEEDATHFDTKEEAESWANSHQEVLEVEV